MPVAWTIPRLSSRAHTLYTLVESNAGCVRLRPLMQWSGLSATDLCEALNELMDRRWIDVIWREGADEERQALSDIERITITRFGRFRARFGWPVDQPVSGYCAHCGR